MLHEIIVPKMDHDNENLQLLMVNLFVVIFYQLFVLLMQLSKYHHMHSHENGYIHVNVNDHIHFYIMMFPSK